jgi:hypothetical protein
MPDYAEMSKILSERAMAYLPDVVKRVCMRDGVLLGGAINSIAHYKPVKDYDVFFFSQKDLESAATVLDKLGFTVNSDCETEYIKNGYMRKEMSGPGGDFSDIIKIDLIFSEKSNTIEKLMKYTDLRMCAVALFGSGIMVASDETLNDIKEKLIVVNHINKPSSVCLRIGKYQNRGYKITDEEITKFCKTVTVMSIQKAKENALKKEKSDEDGDPF